MEWSKRGQLIRNQNTQRSDERNGNTSRKEDCGKIYDNVLQYIVLLFCHIIIHLNTNKL
jgi:hypothetical protein